MNLLDWRLRRELRKSGLPDLPEVRKFMRACYWNGFTFGALERRLPALREHAMVAVARAAQRGPGFRAEDVRLTPR